TPTNGSPNASTIVPPGTTYTWTVMDNPNVTGDFNEVTAQVTISQTLTNTTNVAQTVRYTVTPASGTCRGAPFTVTVIVNPGITISPIADTICSEDSFSVTPTNGTDGIIPAGTTYAWSVPSVSGGLTGGSAGSGSNITGSLSNPTNSSQTATYTVTPSLGPCSATPFEVTITVNPK